MLSTLQGVHLPSPVATSSATAGARYRSLDSNVGTLNCSLQVDWLGGAFRDCNGVSNGQGLPDDVIKLEAVFASIALGSPGIGPVGPIVIGGNGPVGGAGGDAGNGGSVAPWEQRDQKSKTADNEIALGGGGGGGFETEKF